MKKLMVSIGGVFLLAACLGFAFLPRGRRPMKDLDAGEVVSATVHCLPPDTTYTLTGEETEKLVSLLQQVEVYGLDSTYGQYSGQLVLFTLTQTDGKVLTAQAYAPFFIIDGVGYQTKYEPCEALNQFANQLISVK